MTHTRKMVKKQKVTPRTDANQGICERNERIRKQNAWKQKKIEEFREKMEELRKEKTEEITKTEEAES